ncbi:MAG: hypothetical protein HZC47_03995 [Methanobacterium sp.]|uniref:hypothetical protein n=1 Tax=Methanobacterium sp. TaxID=2164 RepID=UPI003D647B77|nr:hypothetical protein [Methanobacterium sp.]
MASIIELGDRIKYLKEHDSQSYKLFKRVYKVYFETGTMKIPDGMKNKILGYFGQKNESGEFIETIDQVVNRIENQKIVKIFNKWSGEGALFNHIRTQRPGMDKLDIKTQKDQINKLIIDSKANCDFCNAEKYTPEDVFGRVIGEHSVTAANIAKYDVWSSLVVFNNHNPLEFNLEELSDYINTGFKWFEKVFLENEEYKFPFFVWNCLYKAGASQIHGHAQILMSKDISYAKTESMKKTHETYQNKNNTDYFQDIYKIHDSLGLVHEIGDVKLYAPITPTKEKEIIINPLESPFTSKNAKKVIFNILRYFIDALGVHSYNMAIYCPPLNNNSYFPYLIKIVDRGTILKPTADIGGMELYGSTVIAEDPYNLIHNIKEYF